jgi:hypothetical protein
MENLMTVIQCQPGSEDGYVVNCVAPCGCVFGGEEEDVVQCEHGIWILDP